MSHKPQGSVPACKPEPGSAPGGDSINPVESTEPEPQASEQEPRPAPAPGVPMTDAEYERLKEAAKHAPPPPVQNAQEDRPKKKK